MALLVATATAKAEAIVAVTTAVVIKVEARAMADSKQKAASLPPTAAHSPEASLATRLDSIDPSPSRTTIAA